MKAAAFSGPIPNIDKRTFRVIPAGRFNSKDGRPANGSWQLTEQNARSIVALAAQRLDDTVIDYEHASINSKPTPAAGWYKSLEWRPDGLYVTDARWTAEALRMIGNNEFRYISPVILFDDNGLITGLHNIALTQNPALEGLTDLAALTAKKAVMSVPLSARIANGFDSIPGMTEQSKRYFVETFGFTSAELKQLNS